MTNPEILPQFEIGSGEKLSKTLTEADVYAYASLVGDFNPLHVNAEYAQRSRFGRPTAHPMLAAGMISALLDNRLPGPDSVCLSQQMEFLAPIYIGDTITARVEVTAWQPEKNLITLRTDCYNQEDRQVITGQAVLMVLPSN